MSNEKSKRFSEIRKDLGLSQKDFGKALDISQNYVSSIENGSRNISSKLLEKLENVYDINPTWLMTGREEMYTSVLDKTNADNELKYIARMYKQLDPDSRNVIKSMLENSLKLLKKREP